MNEIDRALGQDIELEPSSGLTERVLAAVERTADAPEPIRLPWLRFLPMLIAFIAIAIFGATQFSEIASTPLPEPPPWAAAFGPSVAAMAGSLAFSVFTVRWARR